MPITLQDLTNLSLLPIPDLPVTTFIDEDNDKMILIKNRQVFNIPFGRVADEVINNPNLQTILNDLSNKVNNLQLGITGIADPTTNPQGTGFQRYIVSVAGTYNNFRDADGNPLVVTQIELDQNIVEFWGKDNVWEKHLIPVLKASFATLTADSQVFLFDGSLDPVPDRTQITISVTEHDYTSAPGDIKWQVLDGDGINWNTLLGEVSRSLVVPVDASYWGENKQITIRYYYSDTINDQMTIYKVYAGKSNYVVVITSEFGDTFLNGNINTTLTAYFYFAGINITDQIPDSAFIWTRKSDDEAGDTQWNLDHATGTKSVAIDETMVFRIATFNCDVQFTS